MKRPNWLRALKLGVEKALTVAGVIWLVNTTEDIFHGETLTYSYLKLAIFMAVFAAWFLVGIFKLGKT